MQINIYSLRLQLVKVVYIGLYMQNILIYVRGYQGKVRNYIKLMLLYMPK